MSTSESVMVAEGLRDAARLCAPGQAALAERLRLGAAVISSLLQERELLMSERKALLKRAELAEFQARTNKATIERMTNEQVRVAIEDALSIQEAR